jgi:hypothetical protein
MDNEIIKSVTEKIGLSEEQASSATEAVSGFLKDKLPTPVAGVLDNITGGGSSEGGENTEGGESGGILGQAQSALGGLGGMFGGNIE